MAFFCCNNNKIYTLIHVSPFLFLYFILFLGCFIRCLAIILFFFFFFFFRSSLYGSSLPLFVSSLLSINSQYLCKQIPRQRGSKDQRQNPRVRAFAKGRAYHKFSCQVKSSLVLSCLISPCILGIVHNPCTLPIVRHKVKVMTSLNIWRSACVCSQLAMEGSYAYYSLRVRGILSLQINVNNFLDFPFEKQWTFHSLKIPISGNIFYTQ